MNTRVAVIRAIQPDEIGNQTERFIPIETPDGKLMYRRLYKLLLESAIPDVSTTLLEDILIGINTAIEETPDWLFDLSQRILSPKDKTGNMHAAVFIAQDNRPLLSDYLKEVQSNDDNTSAENRVKMAQSLIGFYLEFKKRQSLTNNLPVCRYVHMLQSKFKEHAFW